MLIAAAILTTVGFALFNVLCYRHARAFTHYAPAGDRPPRPESLSFAQKLRYAASGVPVPRPENDSHPGNVGLAYTTHHIPAGGDTIEAWHADRADARGTVVLGHGYMACKSSLLHEARQFHDLGFAVLLIDFRGSGGSSRSDCTLGVREGEDFATAVRFADATWPGRRVILFGASMGAAAALKAVAVHEVTPSAMILEAPFDRMLSAVRVRFGAMRLPAWPAADLVVFWGGRQLGFDGFAHNPAADAAAVTCPVLVLHGDADPRATPAMVRAVFDALGGPKASATFPGVGHESTARADTPRWRAEVSKFLP